MLNLIYQKARRDLIRDRITTKIDVDYKTNTVTKSVKRRMGAWRVIITPLNLHNSESLVIIYGNEQRLRWRKAFRIKRQSWCS